MPFEPPRVNDQDLPAELRFLAGGGRATGLILARDWTDHPLGPPAGWSEALKVSLSTILNSPESMILAWGERELTFFFNETYFPLLGPRLEWAMGAPFVEVWADAWAQAKPIIDDAFAGHSRHFDDLPWKLDTDRGVADTFFSFSYSRVLAADGAIAGLFIFTNETTKRVLADAALAASQGELRALNESLERRVEERTAERDRIWRLSIDLMLIADLDGRIDAVNVAWTSLLGWSADELVGGRLFDFVHPDDIERTVAAAGGIASGATLTRFENRYRHRDGSYRDIVWTASAGAGKIVAVGRDETENNARSAALAATEDALRQAQKMEAVGQLTGGLAHDFNNLLAGISGNLELTALRLGQGRVLDVERYVVAAQGAAKRAAALTHRLLAFSRRQTLAPEPTDVGVLVRGMEELIQRTIGPTITLETVAATGLWTALVDPPQLENALLNLCINARDAMPAGGRITVRIDNRELPPPAAAAFDLPAGSYLALCVADTGTGMPPEVIAKAFDPFFTTKPIGEGTGLGLSMIYGFAKQSGGQVQIDSTLGQGTAITIFLPRHEGLALRPAGVADPHVRSPTATGETVLVVDDEPTVRGLVGEVLGELGYRVLEASDSASGMAVLRSDAGIDLLVTDIGLPGGMNGRQLADAARHGRPDLRVLFMTGYAESTLVDSATLPDRTFILAKPFGLDALTTRVREMLAG